MMFGSEARAVCDSPDHSDPEGVACPACRLKIKDRADHEPDCPNRGWSRQDVIDDIMAQSAQAAWERQPNAYDAQFRGGY